MNGDGIDDLFTGCFEGGLYVIPGTEGGGYAEPVPVRDKDGDILRVGQYWDDEKDVWTGVESSEYKEFLGISGALADWDADGDQDLVLGTNEGRIFVRLNEGTSGKPEWATESLPVELGDTLTVPGKHAMPVCADWDGDGLFDLVSGGGGGGVHWWRNAGKEGEPAFGNARKLVAAKGGAPDADGPAWPGRRTQVHVTDWDHDGDLDLLVGDYSSGRKPGGGRERHGWVWLVKRKGPPRAGN